MCLSICLFTCGCLWFSGSWLKDITRCSLADGGWFELHSWWFEKITRCLLTTNVLYLKMYFYYIAFVFVFVFVGSSWWFLRILALVLFILCHRSFHFCCIASVLAPAAVVVFKEIIRCLLSNTCTAALCIFSCAWCGNKFKSTNTTVQIGIQIEIQISFV